MGLMRWGAVVVFLIANTYIARADCADSGVRCEESEKIRDQAVREGNQTRADWANRSRSGGSGPPEAPMCITADTIDRHCTSLRNAAAERWDWSDDGWSIVINLLRGGPTPHCFTSRHSLEERIRVWSATCRLSQPETLSLLGHRPGAEPPPSARTAPGASGGGGVAEAERRREEQWRKNLQAESARTKARAAAYRAKVEAHRADAPRRAERERFESAWRKAEENRAQLIDRIEKAGFDPDRERRRCAFGDEDACESYMRFVPDQAALEWAWVRMFEAKVHNTIEVAHLLDDENQMQLARMSGIECTTGDAEHCRTLIEWHASMGVWPNHRYNRWQVSPKDPVYARWLARRTCEADHPVNRPYSCQLLKDIIHRAAGGSGAATASEAAVLREACREAGEYRRQDENDRWLTLCPELKR